MIRKYLKVLFLLFLLPVATYAIWQPYDTDEPCVDFKLLDTAEGDSSRHAPYKPAHPALDLDFIYAIEETYCYPFRIFHVYDNYNETVWQYRLYAEEPKAVLDAVYYFPTSKVDDRQVSVIPEEITAEDIKYDVVEVNIHALSNATYKFAKYPREIIVPSSITSLRNQAFAWTDAAKVSFQDGGELLKTGILAFHKAKITNFILPARWKTIRWGTFYDCKNLEAFYVPCELESIDETAFTGCDNLKDIYIFKDILPAVVRESPEDVPVIDCKDTQYGREGTVYTWLSKYDMEAWDPKDVTLHVPSLMVETYRNAYFWNRFKDIVAITENDIANGIVSGICSTEESLAEISAIYTTNGVKTDRMHKGVNIVRMSDGTVRKVQSQ